MVKYVIILVVFLCVPAFGQGGCDLNGDGLDRTIEDLIFMINILSQPPDVYYICDLDCDLDEDGISVTIADIFILNNILIDPYYMDNPPDFPYHPDLDTLQIESSSASPDDNLTLPVYLKTIDTLTAYEFYIYADTNYIEIDSVISNLDNNLLISFSHKCIHGYAYDFPPPIDSILLLPGEYYLADIYVHVNPDINEPVVTHLTFSGCPEENFYTGLANLTFFEPVLIDAEITIMPTGIDDYADTGLPSKTSITAYPNPFNSSVNITAISDSESKLVIYDLLGREIRSFPLNTGENNIIWNADDEKGLAVNSGVYFAKLTGTSGSSVEKIVYLK